MGSGMLSTVKISDTIEWAKRLTFNRNPVIGNSLEPALTSANMVMQTILGPPFSWWWNIEEVAFTCNPTAQTATITNIAIVGGIATITCNNTFVVGQSVIPSGIGTTTALNGQLMIIQTLIGTAPNFTGFTAQVFVPDVASHADTGTITASTTQDYVTPNPEFSHIDHAAILDINPNPAKWLEIEVKQVLSQDSTKDRPRFVSPHQEDGNGNMTWRVMPSPDKAYPIVIHINRAPALLTSVNSTWAPIPDFMQYVYNWGFLALMWAFADDPRFSIANQKFTAGLLARAEGLKEEERNAFLNAWNGMTSQAQMQTQQGIQARGI